MIRSRLRESLTLEESKPLDLPDKGTEKVRNLPEAAQPPRAAGWVWRTGVPRGAGAGAHACICLRAEGLGRSRRSRPDSVRSGPRPCGAGNADSGQTGGRSCPRRWGPRSHGIGTAGRAGEPQRAPEGPRSSRHHRSHSVALGGGGRLCAEEPARGTRLRGPQAGRVGIPQVSLCSRAQPRGQGPAQPSAGCVS